jgi:hypothetical protein
MIVYYFSFLSTTTTPAFCIKTSYSFSLKTNYSASLPQLLDISPKLFARS